MKNSTKYILACILAFIIGVAGMFILDHTVLSDNPTHVVENKQ